eukprot:CAMPEP_0174385686 /NCGR_PEP_ID=MMETSP0811_2-20130205/126769_1 /TAXON_ID=73025 ORGANISM="Eutreptiella gymnastica-like, Strain CCMP1594" /NCGR_SAMPLE_ID=MMETSP0811_2 /ASSEMBLY_ACC=CAM_ASM_000667 /LENGTH=123 /DNA_ID=CAMNT_0015540101 /DNA_START=1178 /DNA_END=1546 /DNA_ORIENTATION=-
MHQAFPNGPSVSALCQGRDRGGQRNGASGRGSARSRSERVCHGAAAAGCGAYQKVPCPPQQEKKHLMILGNSADETGGKITYEKKNPEGDVLHLLCSGQDIHMRKAIGLTTPPPLREQHQNPK